MKARNIVVAAVVVLAAGAFVLAQNKPQQKQQADTRSLQGKKAPAFELETLDGQSVALEQMKGNVVVLDFWATWCGPCVKAMPHLQELASNTEMAEKGLKILAVNLREGEDKVKPFIEQNNYTFTVPMDREGKVAESYKVQGIPTQVVVGRDGMVKKVLVGFGPTSAQQLDQAIEMALRAKAPAARGPATQPATGG